MVSITSEWLWYDRSLGERGWEGGIWTRILIRFEMRPIRNQFPTDRVLRSFFLAGKQFQLHVYTSNLCLFFFVDKKGKSWFDPDVFEFTARSVTKISGILSEITFFFWFLKYIFKSFVEKHCKCYLGKRNWKYFSFKRVISKNCMISVATNTLTS